MLSSKPTPRPWSEEEVETLIQLIGQGVPENYICDLLGRNAEDIGRKMGELAITFSMPSTTSYPPRIPFTGETAGGESR